MSNDCEPNPNSCRSRCTYGPCLHLNIVSSVSIGLSTSSIHGGKHSDSVDEVVRDQDGLHVQARPIVLEVSALGASWSLAVLAPVFLRYSDSALPQRYAAIHSGYLQQCDTREHATRSGKQSVAPQSRQRAVHDQTVHAWSDVLGSRSSLVSSVKFQSVAQKLLTVMQGFSVFRKSQTRTIPS